MHTEDYFRSISAELLAVQSRVRHLIADRHWPTDGELRESVLRGVIRRSAPTTASVGRGFIVTSNECSTQIDILIHDNAHPVLYRDGDLVFVSPAACRAIIEVKSNLTRTKLSDAAQKLAVTAQLVRGARGARSPFVGLFTFEAPSVPPASVLDTLDAVADGQESRVVDHLALGSDRFVKWWPTEPLTYAGGHRSWHAYELRSMAAGYFVHNLLMHLSPGLEQSEEGTWFPHESKETRLMHTKRLSGA